MFVIFFLLFITSPVLLLVGLINPKIFARYLGSEVTRKKTSLIFFITTIVFFYLAIVTTPPKSSTATTNNPVTNQEVKKTFVFDVPSLVGKDVDQVVVALGNPESDTEPTKEQISLGANQWDKTFKRNGKELLVTYNPTTRKIIDFFVSTDDPSGVTKDKKHLLELGNLGETSPNYEIEFVKAIKAPSSYTGIKVIPNK